MARQTLHSALRTPHLKRLVGHLLNWFASNARDLPWRRTRDPYAIWVSEIMLQQTQVKTVIPYWERWMRELPTIEAAAKASSDKIHKLWEGLGYYTRARNLQKAAKQIVNGRRDELHESLTLPALNGDSCNSSLRSSSLRFPEKYDDVLALPGIGRYTAGAICSIAFNQPTPILDGNVIRVLTRIFGIAENPKEKETNARLWRIAEQLVTHAKSQRREERTKKKIASLASWRENNSCSFLNQSLMELGALVCLPRNPQCGICPVRKLCVAFQQHRVDELPNLGKRETATARCFAAFVVEHNGRFLVRQRPAGVVNAHLWEFPNVEVGARLSESQHFRWQNAVGKIPTINGRRTRCGSGDPRSESIAKAATQVLGFTPTTLTPLCVVKHSITRYRITLEAFRVNLGGTSYTNPYSRPAKSGTRITRPSDAICSSETGIWKTPAQMQRLAFAAAHKKLASRAFNCILSVR